MDDGLRSDRRLLAPAFVIGFAFSGLFDGILLHQVLQWHHLLSLVQGDAFRDLRVQVLADGAFHVLMYLVAAAGLVLLWRRRLDLATEGTGYSFIGGLALGFGAWNVVDVVLFHWVLGIHHIRLNPDEALISDVVWLVVLGLAPLGVGWRLRRRGGGGGGSARRHAAAVAVLLALSSAASLAPRNDPMTAVLFRPGLSDSEVMAAIAAVDGRLAWTDRTGDVVVISLSERGRRWELYRYGALLVGGAGPAGCLGWARAT